jgi:hypothetical protein
MDTVSPEQILEKRSYDYPRPKAAKDDRPPSKDLSHHLSQLSQRRRPSPLKELFQYIHPGILSFAGGILSTLVRGERLIVGMPSPMYFPLEKLSATVPESAAFTAPSAHK